ncbi:tRNA (adenosine(37)-N6)-dimethylallyltransferase MiaA [Rubritalea marina]|uniref:tRNA (adenosine(37)-N6)-dimethylallyltransferase MiaA n=1 Tax=Rubritalea marina TaxID=361055 RepID=UPI000363A2DA|nr:tRNA (adenosine(37)-N6)-dimethylallyltransferase MiaA [Rubritalea marina]
MHQPIYICGSTASGKSALAIEIAKRLDGEVINGDAYQVYQGLEIITAAPSAEELTQVPHHLFSVIDTGEEFDAQRYRELALPVIKDVQDRGKTPIVVGGSGMYLKFITHGPSPVPPSDPILRSELEARSDSALIDELQRVDPEGAAATNLQNRRYVIRALEICLLSGKKMSEIKNDWNAESDAINATLRGALLQWDAEALRQRIRQRTKIMLDSGAIEEVRQLIEPSLTCEKAIGIRQIRGYLNGEISLQECEDQVFYATCQYAKRQRTWFKKEHWLTPLPCDDNVHTGQLADLIEY